MLVKFFVSEKTLPRKRKYESRFLGIAFKSSAHHPYHMNVWVNRPLRVSAGKTNVIN
jgi:hypothetical protein